MIKLIRKNQGRSSFIPKKVRKKLKKALVITKKVITVLRRYLAHIFIRIAQKLHGKNHKYMFITEVIEDMMHSEYSKMKVISIIETHPLVTLFILKTKGGDNYPDVRYFGKELSLQMGCQESDIEISSYENGLSVYITNTAIENLECGISLNFPKLFFYSKEDPLFEKAKNIAIKEKSVSASLLMRKLHISYDRAARIYEELIAFGFKEGKLNSDIETNKVLN